MNKADWFGLIIILIMIVGASLLVYYYTTKSITTCTSDPLRYAINEITPKLDLNPTQIRIILYHDNLVVLYDNTINITDGQK